MTEHIKNTDAKSTLFGQMAGQTDQPSYVYLRIPNLEPARTLKFPNAKSAPRVAELESNLQVRANDHQISHC